jgi:cysteine-rich repeat protein
LQFLDRAIDPKVSAKDRQQVLRFLRSVVSDPGMKTWATEELSLVVKEIGVLETQLQETTKREEAALGRLATLEGRSARDKRSLSAELREAQREANLASSELITIGRQLSSKLALNAPCQSDQSKRRSNCGDAIRNVEAGEECDDGNMQSGDGCTATCRLEP